MKHSMIDGNKLVELITFMKTELEKEDRDEDDFKRGCHVGRVSAYKHMIELVEANIKQQKRKPKNYAGSKAKEG